MSIITTNNAIITVVDTVLTCPICTATFDGTPLMEKKKNADKFCFNEKCPKCKGKIQIVLPFYSGPTRVYERNPPKGKMVMTETEFMVNGIVPPKKKPKPYSSDDFSDIYI
jgi:hypothetical protein